MLFPADDEYRAWMEAAGFRDVAFNDVGSDMTYGLVARR
jgi:hypothetical protein